MAWSGGRPISYLPPPSGAGWTTFQITSPFGSGSGFSGAGTRGVFVSQSTGNDGNAGTVASPVKTLAQGVSLIRDGKPDWLLLLSGDIWTNEQISFSHGPNGTSWTETGTLPNLTISGNILVSTYTGTTFVLGTDTPGTGAMAHVQPSATQNGFVSGQVNGVREGDNLAMTNIDFYSPTRDPNNGAFNQGTTTANDPDGFVNISQQNTHFMVEGCWFRFFAGNACQYGPTLNAGTKFYCRRNVVTDNYSSSGGHSQGVYCEIIDVAYFEENICDNNGWNATATNAGATVFNHNFYIQATGRTSDFRGNLTSQASATGCQQRTGGVMFNNAALVNPIGLDFAGGDLSGSNEPGSAGGAATYNVIMEADDIDGANTRGTGMDLHDNLLPYNVSNNICAIDNSISSSNGFGIHALSFIQTSAVTISNNVVFNWDGITTAAGIKNDATVPGLVTISNNNVDVGGTNNNPGGNAPSEPFPAPSRTAGTYAGTIGLTATTAAFITACRQQRRENYDIRLTAAALNAYIRTGFAMTANPTPPAYAS